MLESLFHEVAGLRVATTMTMQACIKNRLQHSYVPAKFIYEVFKNTYFEEHLPTTASVYNIIEGKLPGGCSPLNVLHI